MHAITLERLRISFAPPLFRPSRLLCSGHLQTLWQLRRHAIVISGTCQHRIDLDDGDVLVLHDDRPPNWNDDDLAVLLIHGLGGDYTSSYMIRLANSLQQAGVRVFRLDMRGCGAAYNLSQQIMHAGRSDDVLAALGKIASLAPHASLAAMGFSLGGNQLLRATGRVGAKLDAEPDWWDQLKFCVAVSPPIDLERCSRELLQWWLRPYNRHFIDCLLDGAPPIIRRSSVIQDALRQRPRTMWEFDDRITAPLAGFDHGLHYYHKTSALDVVCENQIPTLILAAKDDPIVPVGIFREIESRLPQSTRLLIANRGGHLGFVDRQGNCWMDRVLMAWTNQHRSHVATT